MKSIYPPAKIAEQCHCQSQTCGQEFEWQGFGECVDKTTTKNTRDASQIREHLPSTAQDVSVSRRYLRPIVSASMILA